MGNNQVEDRVRKIIAIVFDLPVESVDRQSSKDNIKNWDSMGIINIMVALESEFSISIEVDEAVNLISVENIINLLSVKGIS
jgi:acyl carrier protein